MYTGDMADPVGDLSKAVLDVIDNDCHVDSLDVFGWTNQMDTRVISTMRYICDNKVVVSPARLSRLVTALDAFANHVERAGGDYWIPNCGTYSVSVPSQKLRELARVLSSKGA